MTDNPTPTLPPKGERHGAGTYQMLWDCKFCGTQKLLGVTHRHCPNCGAAQDPEQRYFPAEEDMVALADHKFVGADKLCPACSQPNSAASAFCSECGADLSGAETAARQETRVIGTGRAESDTKRDVVKAKFDAEMERIEAQAPEPTYLGVRRSRWVIGAWLALIVLVVGGIIYAVTYRSEASAEIVALDWERTVEIEVFGPVEGQNWQDSVPTDARDRICDTRERRKEQVQVGTREECQDVAQGDGSFQRQCRNVPVVEERPVYDRWCTYTVDRWEFARSVKASGTGRVPAPAWPEITLAAGVSGSGEERTASQHERYRVTVEAEDGERHTCELEALDDWLRYDVGAQVTLERYITGGADCDTLALAD